MLTKNVRLFACLLLTVFLASCQWAYKRQLDQDFGPEQPVNRDLSQPATANSGDKNQSPADASNPDEKTASSKKPSSDQNAEDDVKPSSNAGNNPAIKSNDSELSEAKAADKNSVKAVPSKVKSSEKASDIAEQKQLYQDAQSVLDQRCVVCHACYDAPCQLKLGSVEGLDRGASPTKVYYGERLVASEPTRLFIDAHSAEQWRGKGFHPVLNEREQSPEANLQLSVLYQLLKQKQEKPLPKDKLLDEKQFTLELNREQSCPKIESLKSYQNDHPLWGMPYGLPAISQQEFSVIEDWVASGSRFASEPLSKSLKKRVKHWEEFFNGTTLKAELVNRYLYEHLYLASLYFPEADQPTQFFKIVRSRTAPGEPIEVIATRRVYDDPMGVVYYRLQPVVETIVNKTHQPYQLDAKREKFWKEIFYKTDYEVTERASYKPEESSNPFITFKQLPVQSRYRFLLEEAEYSIMNFIKGPVCRGQIALDVINDHFWIAFVNPEITTSENSWYIEEHADLLRFPARWESNGGLLAWYDLAKRQKEFLKKKVAYYNEYVGKKVDINESLIWDGDNGKNPNAGLTIFRHFNSATVVKGFAGKTPKTAWVINYPLLERIHYLLVAGFDVHGNLMHQLHTRLYMDFLRMEGEANFIAFLPKAEREEAFNQWYIDADGKVSEYFKLMLDGLENETDMSFKKGNNVRQNIEQLQAMLAKHTHAKRWSFSDYPSVIERSAAKVDAMQGSALHLLPQTAFIRVNDGDKQYWLTLLHHNAHKNITRVFTEKDAWWPERDTATLLPGLVGAYPNVFYDMDIKQLPIFVDSIEKLNDEKDYQALVDSYGIRRTDSRFWAFSDMMHQAYKKQAGVEYGLMDFNRYENR